MLKGQTFFVAASICAGAMIIGTFIWVWQVASRQDAKPTQRSPASRLMEIKARSMAELREGLAAGDYGQLDDQIARLREVNDAASRYLPQDQYGEAGGAFRQALKQFGGDVQSRDLLEAKRSFEELEARCLACHQGLAITLLDKNLKPVR